MGKDKTELIQELMHDAKHIRNIGIVAHIDHGKCVSGDSRLFVSTGQFKPAKQLFEELSSDGILLEENESEKIYDVSHLNFFVNTFDKTKFKIKHGKVTHIWKMKKTDPLIKIRLRNGLTIKTTPEHKFMLWDNGIKEKRADELKLSNFVICPKKVISEDINISGIKKTMLKLISQDSGFFVFLNDKYKKTLHEGVLKDGRKKVWADTKSRMKFLSFYHCVWNGRYRVDDLLHVCDHLGICHDEIYDNIEYLNYRGRKHRGEKSSLNLKLPKTEADFHDFLYLAGLMFGDGNTEGNIDNADTYIHEKVHDIYKLIFGVDVSIKKYGEKCPRINTGNVTFKKLMKILFNFPLIKKSRNIKLAGFIEIVPREMISDFIRGYFDTDGTVEKGRRAVSVSSASMHMMKDLQQLLLKIGCPSQLYEKKSTIYISGKYCLDAFKRHAGFGLPYKQERLDSLVSNTMDSYSYNVIFVPSNTNASQLSISTPISDIFNDIYACQIKEILVDEAEEFVYDFSVEGTHNFVAEGMIIHNTTLSDNLLAGAGMISEELAGQQLFMDFTKQEQERGITIFAANVSMVHGYLHDGVEENFLINLIDTPGHVDFSGDVTRAMRAVDGVVVVCDAVEGVMPQTETVVRQALRERVKPILFINKSDRLIRELKLTPEQMQERFKKIISDVNVLIQKYVEKEFAKQWIVNVENGSVAFGSAYRKWAISVPFMKKEKISFKDIIEYASQERDKELAQRAPLHKIILDMVIRHLPNPAEAQKYRIPKIWLGDTSSSIGKDMVELNKNGMLAAIVTKVVPDPHAGMVATARIFSGTIKRGQEVHLVGQHVNRRIQQVSVYKGPQRVQMEDVPAGNIIGLVGLPEAFSGETICSPEVEIQAFEGIKHIFEPVVTKSIEPSDTRDLTKLITFLKQTSREDPTLAISINEETGEYLVSGLGELHIDAKIERPLREKGIDIKTSPPIVVYRETVRGRSPETEGVSSNRHNRFYFVVEPMEDSIYRAMAEGKIKTQNVKKFLKEVSSQLMEYGMGKEEAKNVVEIHNNNILLDMTKGVQYLHETIELITEAFMNVMNSGPLAGEPCTGIKVRLTDVKLHDDAIHRGPAQVLPAVSDALKGGIFRAKPTLFEPVQTIRIDVPEELMGSALSQVQNRRGQILDMQNELGAAIVKAKLPVAEMFGFEAVLKSATGGKGFYSLIDVVFERIPEELRLQVIQKIRQRKGLTGEVNIS